MTRHIKFFRALILFAMSPVYSQTAITIHLETDQKVDSLYIHALNPSILYAAELKNKTALFEIPADGADQYTLDVGGASKSFWLDLGNPIVHAKLNKGQLKIKKVENSPIYYVQKEYFEKREKFQVGKIGPMFINEAIKENKDNVFVVFPLTDYLRLMQNDRKALLKLRYFMFSRPENVKTHLVFASLLDRIDKLISVDIIDLSKYDFFDETGKKVAKIRDNSYDFYLLDFWFTNCPGCVEDHQHILKNPTELPKNAQFIGLSIDRDLEDWKGYLKEKNIFWDNYLLGEDQVLSNDLGIWSFPTYVIIDRAGNILGNFGDYEKAITFLKHIERMKKQGPKND